MKASSRSRLCVILSERRRVWVAAARTLLFDVVRVDGIGCSRCRVMVVRVGNDCVASLDDWYGD